MKKQYVVWNSQDSRKGEFEFNTKTQDHICRSLEEARNLITDRDPDWEDENGKTGYDTPHKAFKIYEITLTQVR